MGNRDGRTFSTPIGEYVVKADTPKRRAHRVARPSHFAGVAQVATVTAGGAEAEFPSQARKMPSEQKDQYLVVLRCTATAKGRRPT